MKCDYPENDKEYYYVSYMNQYEEEWNENESDFESSDEEVAEWTDYEGDENDGENEIESSIEDQNEWDENQDYYCDQYEEVWDEDENDETDETSLSSLSINETCCLTCYFGQPLFVCRLWSPCLRCQLRNADIMQDLKLLSVVVNSQIHQLDNDLITRAQELWPS